MRTEMIERILIWLMMIFVLILLPILASIAAHAALRIWGIL